MTLRTPLRAPEGDPPAGDPGKPADPTKAADPTKSADPPAGDPSKAADPTKAADPGKTDERPAVDWKAKAQAAAERVKALGTKATQADRDNAATIAEMAALKDRADKADREALIAKRDAALTRAGVLPQYHEFAPAVDPTTQEGAKALETWLKDRPQIVVAPSGVGQIPAPPPDTALGKIAKGASVFGEAGKKWFNDMMERANGGI